MRERIIGTKKVKALTANNDQNILMEDDYRVL